MTKSGRSCRSLDARSSRWPYSSTCCSTASISAWACCSRSRRPHGPRRHDELGGARSGTATRPGSCSVAAGCSRPFRSPSPSSSRRSTSRSSSCCSALIFRGVAFEFRFKSERLPLDLGPRLRLGLGARRSDAGRDHGRFRAGLPVANNKFAGGAFDWLTPFSRCVTAVADPRRLCAAVRGMADHEGRRSLARLGLPRRPLRADRRSRPSSSFSAYGRRSSIQRSRRGGSLPLTW